jgi:lysophospholipase L1-like esterase
MKLAKRYILLVVGLLAMLGASGFLNLVLYRQAKQYYLEINQTRLDPLGLDYYPTDLQRPKAPNTLRVVFFGDSRAEGWTAPPLPGYEFINRGISSQTSTQSLQRFAAQVNSLKPDIVVIQLGVNDLKTVALFPEQQAEIIANCQANIRQIVTASRQLGAVVIISTIFPIGNVPPPRWPVWSEAIDQAVRTVNADIATLASDRVLIFDTASLLADAQGKVRPKYSADELHLNESGYVVLNQKLVGLIQQAKR